MSSLQGSEVRERMLAELAATRHTFHALLEPLSDADLRQPSHNRGWTNGEILFHITFGFILILTLGPMVRVWGRLPKRASYGFARLLNSITSFLIGLMRWGRAWGVKCSPATALVVCMTGCIEPWCGWSIRSMIKSGRAGCIILTAGMPCLVSI